MQYILIPQQNISGALSYTHSGELSGFELRKAFSTDNKEYAQIASQPTITFPTITSTQPLGCMFIGDLLDQLESKTSATSFVTRTPQQVYGSVSKKLIQYAANTHNIFRLTATGKINNLSLGPLYTFPQGKLTENINTTYAYSQSSVDINPIGNVTYAGFMNNGIRRSYTLEYDYLLESEKDLLVNCFLSAKGYLPVWFIEDTADASSWIYCRMPSLSLTEPYAGYFNIQLTVEEF